MPRPKKFTETERHRRRKEQAKVEEKTFRRMQQPTKTEIVHDEALANKMVRLLGLPHEHPEIAVELGALLTNVRLDWHRRSELQRDYTLPVLGGVQPIPARRNARYATGGADARRKTPRLVPLAAGRPAVRSNGGDDNAAAAG